MRNKTWKKSFIIYTFRTDRMKIRAVQLSYDFVFNGSKLLNTKTFGKTKNI